MRSRNRHMTNADRHGTRPRGQALVEFALISPLSFLLFIGCLDFGRVFYSAMAITHAARADRGRCAGTPPSLPGRLHQPASPTARAAHRTRALPRQLDTIAADERWRPAGDEPTNVPPCIHPFGLSAERNFIVANPPVPP